MVHNTDPVKAAGVDKIGDGVLFIPQKEPPFLYYAQVLYDVRGHEYNMPISNDVEEDQPQDG